VEHFLDFVDFCGICGIILWNVEFCGDNLEFVEFVDFCGICGLLWNCGDENVQIGLFYKKNKNLHFSKNIAQIQFSHVFIRWHVSKIPFVNPGRSAKSPYVEISKKQWVFQEHPLFFGNFHICRLLQFS
jgi:hypothetical protein